VRHRLYRVEIRTVVSPSSAVQWVLSGGPYTTASHLRQCQLVCPPPPCPRQATWPMRNLVLAEWTTVRSSAWWSGDPFPSVVCTSSPSTRLRIGRGRYSEWRLAVHEPAPTSRIGTGSNPERRRSPESCGACVQDERDGRGIRRQRFCMPPIGIVTAPPTRTWRTW